MERRLGGCGARGDEAKEMILATLQGLGGSPGKRERHLDVSRMLKEEEHDKISILITTVVSALVMGSTAAVGWRGRRVGETGGRFWPESRRKLLTI